MSTENAHKIAALLAARDLYRDARNREQKDQAAVRLFRAVDELDQAGYFTGRAGDADDAESYRRWSEVEHSPVARGRHTYPSADPGRVSSGNGTEFS